MEGALFCPKGARVETASELQGLFIGPYPLVPRMRRLFVIRTHIHPFRPAPTAISPTRSHSTISLVFYSSTSRQLCNHHQSMKITAVGLSSPTLNRTRADYVASSTFIPSRGCGGLSSTRLKLGRRGLSMTGDLCYTKCIQQQES